MSELVRFIGSTTLRGLFTLLASVIAGVMLVQLVLAVRGMAKPFIGWLTDMPEESVPLPAVTAVNAPRSIAWKTSEKRRTGDFESPGAPVPGSTQAPPQRLFPPGFVLPQIQPPQDVLPEV